MVEFTTNKVLFLWERKEKVHTFPDFATFNLWFNTECEHLSIYELTVCEGEVFLTRDGKSGATPIGFIKEDM